MTIPANSRLNVTLHASSSSSIQVNILNRQVAVITIGKPYIPRPISSEARQILFDRGTAALEEKGYSAQEAAVLAKKGMDWAESSFGSGSSQIENKFTGWINNAPQRADNRSLQTAPANAEVETEIPAPPPPPPLPKVSIPSTADEDGVLLARPEPVERENLSHTDAKPSMGESGFIQPTEPLWENNLDESGKALTKERELHKETTASGGLDDLTGVRELFTETEDVSERTARKNTDTTTPTQITQDRENTESTSSAAKENLPSNEIPASTNAEVDTEIPTPPPPPPLPKASIPSNFRNDAKDTAESATNAEETNTTIETTNGAMQQAITDDVGNSSLDDETQNIRREASTSDDNGVPTTESKSVGSENITQTPTRQSMGMSGFIQPIEPLWENNLDDDVNGSAVDKNLDNTSPASTNVEVETKIPTPPPLPKASIPSNFRNDAKDTAESATNAEETNTTIETTNGAMQQAITDDVGNSSLDDETQNIRREASTSDDNGVPTTESKSVGSENITQTPTRQSMGMSGFIQPIEPLWENNLDDDVNGSAVDKNLDNTSPASTNVEVETKIPTPPPLPKASIPSNFRNDAKDTAESATNAEETNTTIETTNGAMQQAITDDVGNSSLDDETQNIRREASTSDDNGVPTTESKSVGSENISQTATKQSMGKPDFIQPTEPLRENNLDENINGNAPDKNADNTSPASTNAEVETKIPTPPPPLSPPKASRPSTPRNDAKDMGELATNTEDIDTTIETTNGVMPPITNDDDTRIIKSKVVTTSDEDGVSKARSKAAEREKNLEQASTTQLKEGKQFKETKARGGIDDLTAVRELFTEPKDSGGLNGLTGITRLFTTNKSAASGRLQESTALNVTNKLAKDKQTVPAKEYTASDIHKNTTIIRKKAEKERETSPLQASQPKKTTRAKPKFVEDSSTSRKGPKIINRGLDLSGVESSKYARLSNQKKTASAGSKAHQQMVNDRKLLGVYSTSNELSVARSTYKKLQDNLSNLPQSKKIIDVARKYLSENPADQKPLLSEPNSSQLAALESLGLEESATEQIILMAMVDKASESIEQNKQYQHENFMKSLAKVHKVLFGKS